MTEVLKFKDGDEDGSISDISHISIQVVGNGFIVKCEYAEDEDIAVFPTTSELLEYLQEVLK